MNNSGKITNNGDILIVGGTINNNGGIIGGSISGNPVICKDADSHDTGACGVHNKCAADYGADSDHVGQRACGVHYICVDDSLTHMNCGVCNTLLCNGNDHSAKRVTPNAITKIILYALAECIILALTTA